MFHVVESLTSGACLVTATGQFNALADDFTEEIDVDCHCTSGAGYDVPCFATALDYTVFPVVVSV